MKSHGVELSTIPMIRDRNVQDFLDDAPLAWDTVVKKTFRKKEEIMPMQNREVGRGGVWGCEGEGCFNLLFIIKSKSSTSNMFSLTLSPPYFSLLPASLPPSFLSSLPSP